MRDTVLPLNDELEVGVTEMSLILKVDERVGVLDSVPSLNEGVWVLDRLT